MIDYKLGHDYSQHNSNITEANISYFVKTLGIKFLGYRGSYCFTPDRLASKHLAWCDKYDLGCLYYHWFDHTRNPEMQADLVADQISAAINAGQVVDGFAVDVEQTWADWGTWSQVFEVRALDVYKGRLIPLGKKRVLISGRYYDQWSYRLPDGKTETIGIPLSKPGEIIAPLRRFNDRITRALSGMGVKNGIYTGGWFIDEHCRDILGMLPGYDFWWFASYIRAFKNFDNNATVSLAELQATLASMTRPYLPVGLSAAAWDAKPGIWQYRSYMPLPGQPANVDNNIMSTDSYNAIFKIKTPVILPVQPPDQPAIVPVPQDQRQWYKVLEALNVRRDPSAAPTSKIISWLHPGDVFSGTGETVADWVEITGGGWVWGGNATYKRTIIMIDKPADK